MKKILRLVTETGFIIFLFYSNLLMGEFERSGPGQVHGFVWAVSDVFTAANLAIAILASLVGYVALEFFRKTLTASTPDGNAQPTIAKEP